jgi:hypothetical protein
MITHVEKLHFGRKIILESASPDVTDIDTLVTHNFRGKAGEILPKLF